MRELYSCSITNSYFVSRPHRHMSQRPNSLPRLSLHKSQKMVPLDTSEFGCYLYCILIVEFHVGFWLIQNGKPWD